MKQSHTIAVSFVAATFLIAPTSTGPGAISPMSLQTVPFGGSSTFTMTPTAGNRVVSVAVDGTSIGSVYTYTFSNVQADHGIFVTFGPKIVTTLSIRSSATTVRRYATIRLSGSLRPVAPAGTPVTLQVRRPGSLAWVPIWTGGVDAASNWAKDVKVTMRGTYRFRAVFAGDADRLSSTSPIVSVSVR